MRTSRFLAQLSALVALVLTLSLMAAVPAEAATTLRVGARGPAVTELQTRLAKLRYDVGPIDGVFGAQTKHAVVAFQKVNGLARDGVVGPRTRAALANPVRPKVRRVRSGMYLEADLTKQVLYRARDGKVVRVYDASSGTSATPTPLGRYRVERTINGWRVSPLGELWRPAYFHRGYAVHGARSVPPYPASHGCVRLTIPSMNRLWPYIKIGMSVEVYR